MFKLTLFMLAILAACALDSLAHPEVRMRASGSYKSMKNSPTSRIVGGEEALPGQFPYQARLSYKGDHECGAIIIDNEHLLTAAHCRSPIDSMRVIVGDHSQSAMDGEEEFELENFIVHEDYRYFRYSNDIAIIKVKGFMSFNITTTGYGSVASIPLPPNSTIKYGEDELFTVSGWGLTESGHLADKLRFVEVKHFNLEECKKVLGVGYVSDNDICAEGGRKDSTPGDSGGPLTRMTENGIELVGIVSRGPSEGPGVYTKVTSYLDWIKDHL